MRATLITKGVPVVAAAISLTCMMGDMTAAAASTVTRPSQASAGDVQHAPGPLGPLVDLALQRALVGDQVAASKFGTDKPIDDPAREQQELAQVRQDAVRLGIDPDATVAFFQDQITASKVVQRGLFARWTAHPDLAPTTKPDLSQIRTQLDRLTTEIMRQLVGTQAIRQTNGVCQIQLTVAHISSAALNHLDGLHRRALSVALRSVC
jgi:chorismate mutase